ncbi:MAG: glycosyltransferase [Bacilli bacterium]
MKIFRSDPELHCVFLRNECQKGPGGARNKALNNSYNDLILFLDADDLFVYNNSLELLYTNFEQDIDLLEFMSYTKDYTANKMSFIVKRNIISKNNL